VLGCSRRSRGPPGRRSRRGCARVPAGRGQPKVVPGRAPGGEGPDRDHLLIMRPGGRRTVDTPHPDRSVAFLDVLGRRRVHRYLINCLPGEVGAFGGEKARVRVITAKFRTDFRSAANERSRTWRCDRPWCWQSGDPHKRADLAASRSLLAAGSGHRDTGPVGRRGDSRPGGSSNEAVRAADRHRCRRRTGWSRWSDPP
jgi:hypothetical protein